MVVKGEDVFLHFEQRAVISYGMLIQLHIDSAALARIVFGAFAELL